MENFASKDNVIQLKQTLPTDLMSLKELSSKYNFGYDYLYKVTKRTNELPYYFVGTIKVSERTFINWVNSKYVTGENN